jgi:hypothetical protein
MQRRHVWRWEILYKSFRYNPEPGALKVEVAIEKLKKSPSCRASAVK